MSVQTELDEAFVEVATAVKGRVASLNGTAGLWKGTRAEYDLIPVKDPNVVYVIKKTPVTP